MWVVGWWGCVSLFLVFSFGPSCTKISEFSVQLIHEKIILKVRQSIELVGGMNPQRELIHFIIHISRDKLGQGLSGDNRD